MNSKEIARLAGVSRATVSRVINNSANVQPETRDRVMEVIRKYNYVPIEHARMLAGKITKVIGLFIVDIDTEDKEMRVSNSSYFSQFVNCIVDRANKFGYNVLVSIVGSVREFENVKTLFLNKTISGGIFIGAKNNDNFINELLELELKIVVVDREIDEENTDRKCIIVNYDNFTGAYMVVKYLVSLGHREIAHITGDIDKLSGALRLKGYKKALSDLNIRIEDSWIIEGTFSEQSGYRACKELLSKLKPTAVFVGNDSMAIGAMRAIKEAGLIIPEDISIIGFDDVEISKYVSPGLSTIRASLSQMAAVGVESLINSIESGKSPNESHIIPVELIVRSSCKPL